MRKTIKMLFFLLFLFVIVTPVFAQLKLDPILLDEENENIYNCKNDIFIEVSSQTAIGKQFAGRTAEDQYLYMTVKILYLAEQKMEGLDRKSFNLFHLDEEGNERIYPLNFAVTMMSNRIKQNINIAKTLKLPAYWTLDLVFNVDTTNKDNWILKFTPMDRGTENIYCQIDVPLIIK